MSNHFEKEIVKFGDTEFIKPTLQERILETQEVERSEIIPGGINKCILIKLKDDGSGIFKPASGEAEYAKERKYFGQEPRSAVKAGTYYRRERAAYLVDRFLNFNLVPPTVIREIDGEIGSLQEFVDYDHFGFEVPWQNLSEEELMKLFVLDYVLWSSDRGPENFLLKDGKICAIDNGLTFGQDQFYPYTREEPNFESGGGKFNPPPPPEIYLNRPIPAEIREKFNLFLEQGRWQILRGQLLELLPPNEVDACFARIEKVEELIKDKGEISLWAELQFNPTH